MLASDERCYVTVDLRLLVVNFVWKLLIRNTILEECRFSLYSCQLAPTSRTGSVGEPGLVLNAPEAVADSNKVLSGFPFKLRSCVLVQQFFQANN